MTVPSVAVSEDLSITGDSLNEDNQVGDDSTKCSCQCRPVNCVKPHGRKLFTILYLLNHDTHHSPFIFILCLQLFFPNLKKKVQPCAIEYLVPLL